MGPAELIVLTFPHEVITAEEARALGALRTAGDIRVIDSLVVSRHADGGIGYAEVGEVEHLRGTVAAGGHGLPLIGPEDAQEAAGLLEPGTVGVLVLIEHLWARTAAEALAAVGGRIASGVRIPEERIEAAVRAAEARSRAER
ncbi:DUF1269 domain-containing family protein [Kitasatospora sp. NE20-6]|uniref:DUF6325 family protein n=1 Tax=Kitasatospora sp. NE20-6 TaxID=2859066 RepID=UPI0034DC1180